MVREFLNKFGPNEKASDVLTKLAAKFRLQEEASRLTPLQIPTRPAMLTETLTCRALATQKETPDPPPETTISDTLMVTTSNPSVSHSMDVPDGVVESQDNEMIEELDYVEGSGDRDTVGSAGKMTKGGDDISGENVEGKDQAVENEDTDGVEDVENTEEEVLEEPEKGEEEIVEGDEVCTGGDEKKDMEVDGSELSERPELIKGT